MKILTDTKKSRYSELNRGPLPYHGSALPLSYSGLMRYGAGDGARTRNIQLGRLTLYQLSYSRMHVVGRAGFEPAKSKDNRFTVCPSWPLWYLPVCVSVNLRTELAIGFEPTTGGLQNRCSTPELRQQLICSRLQKYRTIH